MNKKQRQIIAEKIGSTVRVLELLGLNYQVIDSRDVKKKGVKSPRVIRAGLGNGEELIIYNSVEGSTWAAGPDRKPISGVKSIEDLYIYLSKQPK